MKFKLDENLGRRGKDLLAASGHDVTTVYDQNLRQALDTEVINACQKEGRCLVTLDLDFGNPLRFKPSQYSGIAVLRLPARPSYTDLLIVIQTLVKAIETESIDRQLWIVERARVRIYRPDS
jgi:predicted nuclease of predicted toxin-antitoxin system